MRDIEPLAVDQGGAGVLDLDDFHATLNGLTVGKVYPAAKLYERYSDVARTAGRSPAHIVAFGQAMARKGHRRVKRRIGGPGRGREGQAAAQVTCWQLT